MSAKPVFGIDVAKAGLVIADAVDSPIIRLPNQIPTIRRWLKQLPGSCRFGWESTSDFHRTPPVMMCAYSIHAPSNITVKPSTSGPRPIAVIDARC